MGYRLQRAARPWSARDQGRFPSRGHRGDHEQHLFRDRVSVRMVQPGADAGQNVQVDAAGVQVVFQQHQQLLHRPRQSVRLVDSERVAWVQVGQRAAQLRPGVAGAGGLDHDFPAVGGGQRVELRLVVLRPGAHPRAADPDTVVEPSRDAQRPIVPYTVSEPAQRHAVPGLVCGRSSPPGHAVVTVPEMAVSATVQTPRRVTLCNQ
jgi:hypothetical protein